MPAPLSRVAAGCVGVRRCARTRASSSSTENGLVDVVGRAGVQRPSTLSSTSPERGEHDHRQLGLGGADAAQHLDALAPGQHAVEDHEVDVGAQRVALAVAPVARRRRPDGPARAAPSRRNRRSPRSSSISRMRTGASYVGGAPMRRRQRTARSRSASAGHALTARAACSLSSAGIDRVDHRIAPVVEHDALGQQLRAQAVAAHAMGSSDELARPAGAHAALPQRPRGQEQQRRGGAARGTARGARGPRTRRGTGAPR